MSHTNGLLHITGSGDRHWMREGRDENNSGVFWCGSSHDSLAIANARRLVACWNACRHLSTEQLEAGDLDYAGCSTLADIRAALEVGDKPMLGKLAGIVREIREQAERGGVKIAEWRQKAGVLRRAMCLWRDMAREYLLILKTAQGMNIERAEEAEAEVTRIKRERDEAVEALRRIHAMKMAHVNFAPAQYYICVQSIAANVLAKIKGGQS